MRGTVRVGEQLDRTLRLSASSDKRGRSGPPRFVTAEAIYRQASGGDTVMVEEHDLVYHLASTSALPTPAAGPPNPT
jgi:hydroxyacyl-ACP dehydratase HTD2-like protein with hotdog domain